MRNDKEFLTAQELKDRITNNDNRCTAKPYLLLLRARRTIVVDGEFAGNQRFVENSSGDYHTSDTQEDMINIIRNWYGVDDEEYSMSDKELLEQHNVKEFFEDEYFETVNVFLTDQGYQDHMLANGHNIREHDTYGIHAFRNREIKSLFNLIDENIDQQKIIGQKNEEIRLLDQYKKVAESYYPFNEYVQKNSKARHVGRNYGDIAVEMLKSKDKEIDRLKKENEELRIMDKSYKLNWANDRDIINKKDEKIERYKELLNFMIKKKNKGWLFTYEDMKKLNSLMKAISEVENE